MSDIIESLKDAINPKRREEATPPDYDPHKRGPYTSTTAEGQPKLIPVDGREESNSSKNTSGMTAPDTSPKRATNAGFNAPEGTYGPHNSRLANALDPRVDSDRDGHPAHGASGYGGAAAQPLKKTK